MCAVIKETTAQRAPASRCRFYPVHWATTSCTNSSVQEEEIMATLLGSESPCTGGKRRNCNSNIVTKLTAGKIRGQGFSRGTQVRQTAHVWPVKTSESWSSETRDLRLECSLNMKTLSWRLEWSCTRPCLALQLATTRAMGYFKGNAHSSLTPLCFRYD